MALKLQNTLILLAGLLFVAGCNTSQQARYTAWPSTPVPSAKKATSAENILENEGGPWKMVEVEDVGDVDQEETSPIHDHMKARKKVNPSQTKLDYTKHYDPQGEEVHVRTLRMEPSRTGLYKNYARAAVKPGHKPKAKETLVVMAKPSYKPVSKSAKPSGGSPVPKHKPGQDWAAKELVVANNARDVSQVAPSSSRLEIGRVRFGNHPGHKVRMVLDVSGDVVYRHQLDNKDNVFVITVDDVSWGGGQKMKIIENPLILGYRAQPGKNGTTLTVKLKQQVHVKWAAALPPKNGRGNRLVFDLVATGPSS